MPARLTLEDAVRKALDQNPQTRITEAGTRIAEGAVAEARTGRKPTVQFSQSVIRSNNPVFVFGSLLEQGRFTTANFALDALNHPSGLNNFRTLVSAQMPILDQRQTASRVTRANLAKQQSELQAESVRQQLRFEVIRNFYGTILAREQVAVTREAVRSAEANSKKTRDMVEVGMTTDADMLAADVELAGAEQQRLEAESSVIISLAALNISLGDKPDLDRELGASLAEKYFPIEEVQDDLIRIALEERPDYQRALLELRKAREQTQAVRNTKLPRVEAFGNYGYSSPYITNGSSDYTVGVSLNYTLFDAGRKARVEQAVGAEMLAEAERADLENRIRFEVIRATQNHRTARAKIQVSVKSIAQADEALRIVQDRYKFGLTTFNEVIRAESALVRAKQSLLAARYDYYISYSSILLATGRLSDVRAFD